LNGEKGDLANQVYTKLARYESSRAMVEKYVTDDMRERTLSVCYDLRDTDGDGESVKKTQQEAKSRLTLRVSRQNVVPLQPQTKR